MKTIQALSSILLAAAALAAAGCAGSITPANQSASNPPASELGSSTPVLLAEAATNRVWSLENATANGAALPLPDRNNIYIKIDRDGEITGRAGVNAYYGTALLRRSGSLNWQSPLAFTGMGASQPVLDVQRKYLSALSRADRANLEGDRLVLAGPGVRLVFRQDAMSSAYVAR